MPTIPSTNPLLAEWATPFGVPPFDQIRPDHFAPAYAEAMAAHQREVPATASDAAPPTFANTIETLERSGVLLSRVHLTFNNLSAAETNAALQEISREIAPRLAAHRDDILLDRAPFRRVQAVWEGRSDL